MAKYDPLLIVTVRPNKADPNGNEHIGVIECHPPGCSMYSRSEALAMAQGVLDRIRDLERQLEERGDHV